MNAPNFQRQLVWLAIVLMIAASGVLLFIRADYCQMGLCQ